MKCNKNARMLINISFFHLEDSDKKLLLHKDNYLMNLQARIQAFTHLGEYLKTEIYQEAAEELNLAKCITLGLLRKILTNPLVLGTSS